MPKISALPPGTQLASADAFPFLSRNSNVTERVSFDTLQSAVANAGTVQNLIRQNLSSGLNQTVMASNVNFLPADAGGMQLPVSAYLNLNVKGLKRNFGAIGDGGADDTLPVTNAFASGKTIEVEEGTFNYSSGGAIFRATDVRGYGPLSVLNYTGAGKALSAIGVGSGDNWKSVLAHFRIISTGTHGLLIQDLGKFEVDDLTINGASISAIELAGSIGAFCLYVDIHHCSLQNNSGDGIFVNNTGSAEINVIGISDNLIQGNNGCAINAKGGSYRAWTINNNDLEGNGGAAGIYLNGGNGVEITANYWEDVVSRPALLISDTGASRGVKISANHFQANIATINAITLGVSNFVTGVSVKNNSFLGLYTNAINPATVISGEFGPNNLAAGINHLATPGGNTRGITSLDSFSFSASKIYPGLPSGSLQAVSGIFAGNGLASNAQGVAGDNYFRGDGGLGSSIYKKFLAPNWPLGSWTPII